MIFWYISFATDEGFRGATVVEGDDANGALGEATKRGLNPGGEAVILEVPPEAELEPDMWAMRNRLLNREEMIAQGGKRLRDIPEELQDRFEAAVERVCADCNSVGDKQERKADG